MEHKKYTIRVDISGAITQEEKFWEVIRSCMTEGRGDLRTTTLAIAGSHEYNSEVFNVSGVENYKGCVLKSQYMPHYTFLIMSEGLFPTKFFEAIESQFPCVVFAFWAETGTYTFSYQIGRMAVEKICCPLVNDPILSMFRSGRSMEHSFLLDISRRLGYTDLSNVPFWVIEEYGYIPDEDVDGDVEPKLWDPFNPIDERLEISDENLKKFFPKQYEKRRSIEEEANDRLDTYEQHQRDQALSTGGKIWKIFKKILKILVYLFVAMYILALFM